MHNSLKHSIRMGAFLLVGSLILATGCKRNVEETPLNPSSQNTSTQSDANMQMAINKAELY